MGQQCVQKEMLSLALIVKVIAKEDIIGLAIVADCSPIASPCGACRQVLSELVDLEMPIFLANKEKVEKHTIGELLPMVFIGESL